MAFKKENFNKIGGMAQKGGGPQVFSYKHEAETVTGANYFDSVAGLLEPGDIIFASKVSSSGTASEVKMYYVASITAGVVTVTAFGAAA